MAIENDIAGCIRGVQELDPLIYQASLRQLNDEEYILAFLRRKEMTANDKDVFRKIVRSLLDKLGFDVPRIRITRKKIEVDLISTRDMSGLGFRLGCRAPRSGR